MMHFRSRAMCPPRHLLCTILASLAFCGVRQADAEVFSFLSSVGAIDAGVSPGTPSVLLDVDQGVSVGSLYLWLQNEDVLQSASFDISAETPGVIEFLGAEVFQADLVHDGLTFGKRWNEPLGNGRLAADRQRIEHITAVNVNQYGLNPRTRSADGKYDSAANAALFARIDFRALGGGTTNLQLSMGNALIVENAVVPGTSFGSAAVAVTGLPLYVPPAPPAPGNHAASPPAPRPPAIPSAPALPPPPPLPGHTLSFLSPIGATGGGAAPQDPHVHMDVDQGVDVSSLYLWLRNDEKFQSASFNIEAETPGVIEFLGSEVFQADVLVDDLTIGKRWNEPLGNGRVSADRQQISNIVGVNVTEQGLNPTTKPADSLYDSAADAALFARVDFRALGAGTTNLRLSEGSALMVQNGVHSEATYGSATVSVSGLPVYVPPPLPQPVVPSPPPDELPAPPEPGDDTGAPVPEPPPTVPDVPIPADPPPAIDPDLPVPDEPTNGIIQLPTENVIDGSALIPVPITFIRDGQVVELVLYHSALLAELTDSPLTGVTEHSIVASDGLGGAANFTTMTELNAAFGGARSAIVGLPGDGHISAPEPSAVALLVMAVVAGAIVYRRR
jgi:hypothetical protein